MNNELLKYVIKRSHKTQDDVAKALGISRQSLSSRLNGTIEFRLTDIRTIKSLLCLTEQETVDIFLR